MASFTRTMHLLGVVWLAVAVLAQPAAALPRVECVPRAICAPADGPTPPVPSPARHACCPAGSAVDHAANHAPAAAVLPAGGLPPRCCVVTAGVPVDARSASAPATVPGPSLDPLATPPPADPGILPPAHTLAAFAARDRPWLPPWQLSPEQGIGARPPPTA